jgi:hypothetical protein
MRKKIRFFAGIFFFLTEIPLVTLDWVFTQDDDETYRNTLKAYWVYHTTGKEPDGWHWQGY